MRTSRIAGSTRVEDLYELMTGKRSGFVFAGTPDLPRLPMVNGGRTYDGGLSGARHLQDNSRHSNVPIRPGGVSPRQPNRRPDAFHSPSLPGLLGGSDGVE
jgi:hypothetical protein